MISIVSIRHFLSLAIMSIAPHSTFAASVDGSLPNQVEIICAGGSQGPGDSRRSRVGLEVSKGRYQDIKEFSSDIAFRGKYYDIIQVSSNTLFSKVADNKTGSSSDRIFWSLFPDVVIGDVFGLEDVTYSIVSVSMPANPMVSARVPSPLGKEMPTPCLYATKNLENLIDGYKNGLIIPENGQLGTSDTVKTARDGYDIRNTIISFSIIKGRPDKRLIITWKQLGVFRIEKAFAEYKSKNVIREKRGFLKKYGFYDMNPISNPDLEGFYRSFPATTLPLNVGDAFEIPDVGKFRIGGVIARSQGRKTWVVLNFLGSK